MSDKFNDFKKGFDYKLKKFMFGRNGIDNLGNFLFGVIFVCMILSCAGITPFYYIGLLLLIYTYYRILSRQTYKRLKENQKFLEIKYKAKTWFQNKVAFLKKRKTYHIYRCPNCKQKIRIPRGKGRIAISCPKCHTEFIKRS